MGTVPTRLCCCLAATLLLLGGVCTPVAQGLTPPPVEADEYAVRAAVLLNLAKFVTWPSEAFTDEDDPLIIGVLGSLPYKDAFLTIDGKQARGRPVITRYFTTPEEISSCHILYIAAEPGAQGALVAHQRINPFTLTVSEQGSLCEDECIVMLSVADDRLSLTIRRDKARAANLILGASLLKLATVIGDEAP